MIESLVYGVLAGVFIVLCGFFSGCETGAISANRLKIRNLQLRGDQRADEVLELLRDTQRVIAATLVGTNLCIVVGTLFGREFFQRVIPGALHTTLFRSADFEQLIDLIVLTPLFLILGEMIPKQAFRMYADALMLRLRLPLKAFLFLFIPVVRLANGAAYVILRPLGIRRGARQAQITKDDLHSLVSEGAAARPDETSERQMIASIFRLEKTLVREVMRPLVDVVAVRVGSTSLEDVVDLVRRTGYSRIPVFRDRIVDMIGYIDIYKVLAADRWGKSLEDFVEEAYFVPETKRVDDLLHEFLLRKLRVAIIIDESGGCSGWVTLEDLLEEIVGEIRDEYDRDKKLIAEQPDGSYLVDAKMDVDDLNQQLGLGIAKKDFETIGGYIYHQLGRVPQVGDKIFGKDFAIQVATMDRHKILTVVLTKSGQRRS
jgi:putative hemolysin